MIRAPKAIGAEERAMFSVGRLLGQLLRQLFSVGACFYKSSCGRSCWGRKRSVFLRKFHSYRSGGSLPPKTWGIFTDLKH